MTAYLWSRRSAPISQIARRHLSWPSCSVAVTFVLGAAVVLPVIGSHDEPSAVQAAQTPQRPDAASRRSQLMHEAEAALLENRYETVRRLVNQVAVIDEANFGQHDFRTAETLDKLADVLIWLDQFAAAKELRQRVRETAAVLYGATSWQAKDAGLRIRLLVKRARLNEADRRTLTHADEKHRQSLHLMDTGQVYQALAAVNEALGRYEELAPGTNDDPAEYPPHLLSSILRVQCLAELGRFEEAVSSSENLLAAAQRLYSESDFPGGHPNLAQAYCSVATVRELTGHLSRQATAAEKAAAIGQSLYAAESEPAGSPVSAMTQRIMARSCISRSELGRAEVLTEQAYETLARLFPERDYPAGNPHLATTLDLRGNIQLIRGNYDLAMKLLNESLAMRQRLYPLKDYPRGHRRLTANLTRIGTTLQRQGKYQEAVSYYQRALEMTERLYPQDDYPRGHVDIASQLTVLGDLEFRRGNYPEAQQLAMKSLDMTLAIHGHGQASSSPDHPHIAKRLAMLGRVLSRRGQFGEAKERYLQSLAIAERLFPESIFPDGHVQLYDCYNSLGTLFFRLGDYRQAETYLSRSVSIAESLARDIPRVQAALAMQNLATVLSAQRNFSRSAELFDEALDRYRQTFPRERYPNGHPYLANTLTNLGVTLSTIGQHRAAAAHYEEAVTMLRGLFPAKDYPDGHPLLFTALVNLATEMAWLGDHASAQVCLEQALEVGQRLFPSGSYPKGHPKQSIAHSTIALICDSNGAHQRALFHHGRAVEISRRLYTTEEYPNGHVTLATRLHNIGTSYAEAGDLAAARRHLQEALQMRRKLYTAEDHPDGHPYLASTLHALAFVCLKDGEHELGERHLEEATGIYSRLLERPGSAESAAGLAGCKRTAGLLSMKDGDYAAAADHLRDAVALASGGSDDSMPTAESADVAEYLNLLAKAYHAQGHLARAQAELVRAGAIARRLAANHLPYAVAAEALNYIRSQPQISSRLLSLSRSRNEPAANVYREIWWERGAIQRATTHRRRHLTLAAGNPETWQHYRDWLDRRREIAQLTLAHREQDHELMRQRRERLDELTEQSELLERHIAFEVHEPVATAAGRDPGGELARLLPAGSVFVDVRRYLHLDFKQDASGKLSQRSSPHYVAFVLRPNKSVVRVELGAAAPTDTAIRKWREQITANPAATDFAPAQWLAQSIWKPLESVFPDGTEIVLLCPDGPLTALPWSALPGREPGSVLLERFAFATVPYGDFLLEQLGSPASERRVNAMLAVGGVDYDSSQSSPPNRTMRAPPNTAEPYEWPHLLGTQQEVAGLVEIATPTGTQVSRLSGSDATTVNVLHALQHVGRAHFATHGFFADPVFRSVFRLDPELFDNDSQTDVPEETRIASRNPLALSGLVLAGANQPLMKNELGLPVGDGGILSAEAIAAMQLPQLDLVTLSACDSGLGQLARGEGVFGLQRAFHIAGAETVIASLWKVDDAATQQLMLAFYENLYLRKMTKLAALRHAQLQLHQGTVGKADLRGLIRVPKTQPTGQTAPFLWAAWTLSGDWR